MAFSAISSSLVQAGKAITTTLMGLIRTNFDDHETRIAAIEAGASKIIVFDEIVINAATLSGGGSITGLGYYRVAADFDLTDSKVYIFTKGSLTGNLEIDIQKASSADFTSSVSVFTTKPKIVYSTASNYDESSNAVFDGTNKVLSAGDYLRLDISELPSGGTIGKFGIYLIGEAS